LREYVPGPERTPNCTVSSVDPPGARSPSALTAAHEMSGSKRSSCAVVSTSASWNRHTREVRCADVELVFTSEDVAVSSAVYGLRGGAASTLATTRCSSPDGPTARPFWPSLASPGPNALVLEQPPTSVASPMRPMKDVDRTVRTKPIGTASLQWGLLNTSAETLDDSRRSLVGTVAGARSRTCRPPNIVAYRMTL